MSPLCYATINSGIHAYIPDVGFVSAYSSEVKNEIAETMPAHQSVINPKQSCALIPASLILIEQIIIVRRDTGFVQI